MVIPDDDDSTALQITKKKEGHDENGGEKNDGVIEG
jgi:hypothetical protein